MGEGRAGWWEGKQRGPAAGRAGARGRGSLGAGRCRRLDEAARLPRVAGRLTCFFCEVCVKVLFAFSGDCLSLLVRALRVFWLQRPLSGVSVFSKLVTDPGFFPVSWSSDGRQGTGRPASPGLGASGVLSAWSSGHLSRLEVWLQGHTLLSSV